MISVFQYNVLVNVELIAVSILMFFFSSTCSIFHNMWSKSTWNNMYYTDRDDFISLKTKPGPKEDLHKRCVHFYACICAFASDEKLQEEFEYYINLDANCKLRGNKVLIIWVFIQQIILLERLRCIRYIGTCIDKKINSQYR